MLLSYLLVFVFSLKKDWKDNMIAKTGNDTLFFYLLHPYVLYCLVRLWGIFGSTINIFDACIITLLTVTVLLVMERIRIIHMLVK